MLKNDQTLPARNNGLTCLSHLDQKVYPKAVWNHQPDYNINLDLTVYIQALIYFNLVPVWDVLKKIPKISPPHEFSSLKRAA